MHNYLVYAVFKVGYNLVMPFQGGYGDPASSSHLLPNMLVMPYISPARTELATGETELSCEMKTISTLIIIIGFIGYTCLHCWLEHWK